MKRPSNRNFNSFCNWILHNKPVTPEETEFIRHSEDFIALADGEEGGWFDGVVEDCLSCLPNNLAQVNPHFSCSTRAVKLVLVHTSYMWCRNFSRVQNS